MKFFERNAIANMTPNAATFNRAVANLFAPLAVNAKLTMHELDEGIHEMHGTEFTMRIRRGTGHCKGILVTLLPTAERPPDNNDLSKEIGLGVVAEFHHEKLAESAIDTEEDYLRSAGDLATAAGNMLLPYLLGNRSDFVELKEFVAARAQKAVSEIPDYRFPENVRKKWI